MRINNKKNNNGKNLMEQKTIRQLIKPYKIIWISQQTGINYNTLRAQLNPKNKRRLTLENEIKIRQLLTK